MALAEMCKVRMAVHKTVAGELAAKLQALGCCEFVDKDCVAETGGAVLTLREKRHHINELIGDAKFLLRLLEPYETKKEGSFARMLGDIPALTVEQLASQVDENKFTDLTRSVRDVEHRLTETRAEISRSEGLLSQIAPLEQIKYPLEFFTAGTELMSGVVYAVPKAAVQAFEDQLSSEFGDMLEVQHVPSAEKDPNDLFAVICTKDTLDKLNEATAASGAARADIPRDLRLTATEEKSAVQAKIAELKNKEASLKDELSANADNGLQMARDGMDYWSILQSRFEAMETGDPTDEVLIWELWTPKSMLKKVESAVSEYAAYTELSVVEPDEGEMPPTLLTNPSWSSSVEPLTTMYGTPTYGKTDPTSLMAPFFFVILGMCFGDAGYGLIVGGILGYFLVKHQLSPVLRKFFVLLTIGMVMTIIFGALTGSWFGDSITAFPFLSALVPIMKSVQVLDPMNDPLTLLSISLALGFVQVLFGLAVAFSGNWKSGDKFAAVADQGSWIIFLIALVLTGLSMSGRLPAALILPSQILAGIGAIMLVATQGREKTNIIGKLISGVLSLYNVTGYLGDVLSYSRLLALGLGSAAVGMVINLLANLVSGTPYIGIVLAALIFILGHTFSIVVNLLGAFIHSLRLQYVEFFGKFYDATGREFSPLCNTAQYSRIQESSSVN